MPRTLVRSRQSQGRETRLSAFRLTLEYLEDRQQGRSFVTIGQGFLSSDEFYNNAAAQG
jgi:hypothetical protein